ncbi:hypothetical protein Amet_4372 [Alkaliphilus metalliredigens QYMF]|uniref:Uncharacterized protein n=1 Tax=Alkaliphilus metalliredigens (strain QYMF) TaxID=293826 RepID=A6TKC0_ALKMQ|nr:hypothetical protein [Alkaliphilus metalliredigens]ABR46638.1 hypothetical protein Amet_0410 [Alkaliphilus metalliredigens QYMF]ABR48110.1 hypothetical protein Amet_1947 [Alkaliphilus metalliredigens QYMF]ABR50446.1 hypothetical protein Amet_4372 [Alkaliphilus metalliredigens QYMF]
MSAIQTALREILVSVAIGLIGLAGAYVTYFLNKASKKMQLETEKIQEESKREVLQMALWRLEDVAEKTVTKIEEKTAKVLRAAVKSGKKDKTELSDLAMQAYSEILTTLEPEYKQAIEASLGDAQTYIMNTIEEKVKKVKATKTNTIFPEVKLKANDIENITAKIQKALSNTERLGTRT